MGHEHQLVLYIIIFVVATRFLYRCDNLTAYLHIDFTFPGKKIQVRMF